MNRNEKELIPDRNSRSALSVPPFQSPDPVVQETEISPVIHPLCKSGLKPNGKREQNMPRDSLFILLRDGIFHIISENYSYKTETYYSILTHELESKPVMPSTRSILDAYVVPICLERAKLAGIPVCPWGISQGYIPLPAILYGLNYFATPSDFFVVNDTDKAKEVIKHITNRGKYPFCYQKLKEDATLHSCIAIFGKTIRQGVPVALLAEKVYDHYSIPLVTVVFVKSGDQYLLSSLAPTKYSQLSDEERSLLAAYLTHQDFL
jgi:hypothetical protein